MITGAQFLEFEIKKGLETTIKFPSYKISTFFHVIELVLFCTIAIGGNTFSEPIVNIV